jgi:hypothetical protein
MKMKIRRIQDDTCENNEGSCENWRKVNIISRYKRKEMLQQKQWDAGFCQRIVQYRWTTHFLKFYASIGNAR